MTSFAIVGLIVLFVVALAALLFWVWMLSDCIHHKFRKDKHMFHWFLLIILTFIIGALIYYFGIKRISNSNRSR